jgi:uncharacterized protein (TIGR04255 family)
MNAFDTPRPSFDNPPVNEVVLGVQFEPIAGLEVAHLGLYWDRIRSLFPLTETKGPLAQQVEVFGDVKAPQIQLQLSETYPAPRCWFISQSRTELIQIQADRFLFNWRKSDQSSVYPRYPYVRSKFSEHVEQFTAFLHDVGLGALSPNTCEVTYINHIEVDNAVFARIGQLESVLEIWSGNTSDRFLAELSGPEEAEIRVSYRIPGPSGAPVGRLRIVAEPRVKLTDQRFLLRLTLSARGAPLEPSLTGVMQFLDLGREYVVRGFTSITTARMHDLWR